jgi:hypothetical protein
LKSESLCTTNMGLGGSSEKVNRTNKCHFKDFFSF